MAHLGPWFRRRVNVQIWFELENILPGHYEGNLLWSKQPGDQQLWVFSEGIYNEGEVPCQWAHQLWNGIWTVDLMVESPVSYPLPHDSSQCLLFPFPHCLLYVCTLVIKHQRFGSFLLSVSLCLSLLILPSQWDGGGGGLAIYPLVALSHLFMWIHTLTALLSCHDSFDGFEMVLGIERWIIDGLPGSLSLVVAKLNVTPSLWWRFFSRSPPCLDPHQICPALQVPWNPSTLKLLERNFSDVKVYSSGSCD